MRIEKYLILLLFAAVFILPLSVFGQIIPASSQSQVMMENPDEDTPEPDDVEEDTAPVPQLAPPNAISSKILAAAETYRGAPYRYGASEAAWQKWKKNKKGAKPGIDCGLFAKMVLVDSGLVDSRFPRIAAQQYNDAVKSHKYLILLKPDAPAQPGDLVFFSWKTRHKSSGISHVGIFLGQYKNGKIRVMHASSSRKTRKVTNGWISVEKYYKGKARAVSK